MDKVNRVEKNVIKSELYNKRGTYYWVKFDLILHAQFKI